MTTARSLAALAAGVVVLAGCGSDDDEGGGGSETGDEAAQTETGGGKSAGKSAETIKLSATDFKFAPSDPKVDKAGSVTFVTTNDGEAPHALEVEGPAGEVETENITAGKSARLKVDLSKPGEYVFYCPVGNHRQMGMEGKITVAGGGSGGGSAKKESDDDSGSGPSY